MQPMRSKHTFTTIAWLLPPALGWLVLALLARQSTTEAIAWTDALFGWLLFASYVSVCGWLVSISPTPRMTLIRSLATTLTIAALLACLELPAALKLVHWRLLFEQLSGEENRYAWSYQHDRELGFRRRPGDTWSGYPPSDIESGANMPPTIQRRITFTYDSRGYRNLTEQRQADIVMVGDSYIEGWYVSDNETAASLLQQSLQRPVANLGVAGYGSLQGAIVVQRESPPLKPRVVVWSFFEGNDLYDDEEFENARLAPAVDNAGQNGHAEGFARGQGWKQRSFTGNALRRIRRWAEPLFPNRAPWFGQLSRPGLERQTVYFADYAAVPWSDWIEGRWQRTKAAFEEAAAYAQAHDTKLIIMYVPVKYRVYHPFVEFAPDSPANDWTLWPLPGLFEEFCSDTGLDCIDLTEMFQAAVRRGEMPYAASDTHWGATGHRLVAERLERELLQRGW
jgi:lysophospholipase L1-like esterase